MIDYDVNQQYLVALKDLLKITLKQMYTDLLPGENVTTPQHPLQLWGKLYYHATQLQVTSKVFDDLELRSTIQFDKEDVMRTSDDQTPLSVNDAACLVIDKVAEVTMNKPEILSDILLELQYVYWSKVADISDAEEEPEWQEATTLEKWILDYIPGFVSDVSENVRPHVQAALSMTSDIFPEPQRAEKIYYAVSTLIPVFLRAIYASLKHGDADSFYLEPGYEIDDPAEPEPEGF